MDQPIYHIRVAGHGGPLWSEWFAGLTVTNLENGEAILSGPLPDQAALHGVLTRLRDLGLPLLAVERSTPDTEDPPSR
jgi:hypothetical protein